MPRAGAQLLTVPTNNATFGNSDMTYQQLAMSRVRAVEHGRAVVVSATTGVSAMITADGAVQQETAQRYLEGSLGATEDRQSAGHPAAFDQLRAP